MKKVELKILAKLNKKNGLEFHITYKGDKDAAVDILGNKHEHQATFDSLVQELKFIFNYHIRSKID